MILDKTIQITRYKTSGIKDDKETFISNCQQNFNSNKIYDIDDSPEEEVIGWCDHDSFSTNFNNICIDNLIIASMRIDTKKVSKYTLKKIYTKEIFKIENERNEVLNSGEKASIKERCFDYLMSKTKAEPKFFDMIWNIDTNIVYFFSTNKKANEEFETLFNKTFGKTVENMIPFVMAEQYEEFEVIENLSPCEYK